MTPARKLGNSGNDPRDYDRPSVTVDLVLLTVKERRLHVLLIRRDREPFKGRWALPGGFVRVDESLQAAARRVLRDKARLTNVFIEQLYTFGAVKRDPRARVITVAYFALVSEAQTGAAIRQSPDLMLAPVAVAWTGEQGGPAGARSVDGKALRLAFDHDEILGTAVKRLRGKLDYSPVGFELLPGEFTLRQLQEVHEAILDRKLNKPAFRRRMLDKGVLRATGRRETGVTYRPAELYRFVRNAAEQSEEEN